MEWSAHDPVRLVLVQPALTGCVTDHAIYLIQARDRLFTVFGIFTEEERRNYKQKPNPV